MNKRAVWLSVVLGLSANLPGIANEPPSPAPAAPAKALSEPDLRGPLPRSKPESGQARPARGTEPASTPAAADARQSAQSQVATASGRRGGILGYIAGSAAEVPVAICRQSAREFDAGVRDLTNDSDNPLLKAPAMLISLPFSLAAGCLQGAVYAVRYHANDGDAPENMRKMSPETTN